jgi:hypothetical protein
MIEAVNEVSPGLAGLLERPDWEEIYSRLLLHASQKIKRLYWRGIRGASPPGGAEAADIVNGAILKFLSGKRNLPPDVDLFHFFQRVIDSDINHLAESWDNRKCQLMSALSVANDDDETEEEYDLLEQISSKAPSQLDEVLQEEEESLDQEFLLGFFDSLSSEPDLEKIVECFFDGIFERADIASRLNVKATEIDNRRKRLKRRALEYREKWRSERFKPKER